jgi:hypothetical protein
MRMLRRGFAAELSCHRHSDSLSLAEHNECVRPRIRPAENSHYGGGGRFTSGLWTSNPQTLVNVPEVHVRMIMSSLFYALSAR